MLELVKGNIGRIYDPQKIRGSEVFYEIEPAPREV